MTHQPAAEISIAGLRRAMATSSALQMAVVGAAYILGAVVGLRLAADNPNVTMVWPPTGIAVAAIVLLGPRVWPGIAAGAILSNVFNGAPIETALAISVGNTLAPLVAGIMLRRSGFHPSLDRLKDVASLLLVGAVGGMLISSVLGTAVLSITGQAAGTNLLSIWFQWWIGDSFGVIIVAPVLLTMAIGASRFRGRGIETSLLFGATLLVGLLVFQTDLPLRYLVFPLVLWTALRFDQPASSVLTLIISTLAIMQRARGQGLFHDASFGIAVLSLQGFNATLAVVSLSLSAVSTERARAQAQLRRAAAELEGRVARRTAELQASEVRMREAQALAHIGSWHWEVVSNRVIWTDELYRIYGMEPQEFPATFEGYLSRVHPEHREQVESTVQRAIGTTGTFDHQYRIVRPSGEVRWVHARGEAVVDDATGMMLGLSGFCHDITERKKFEDSLRAAFVSEREAARRLRAIDEMKDSLLAAVSHELRTPLTVIIGVADTLQRADLPVESEDGRYLLSRLAANAQRLDKLLKDLLDLDRLNRGVIEPRPRPTDVRELVERVLHVLEISSHPVSVELEHSVLAVDAAQIERIVENLLVNASKHTPAGTQVWIRSEPCASGIVLVVEDAGPGVAPELRSVIFEPFRQGNTSSHAPGTGIGLSLVARFAHINGGRAWLEERPGGGASFRVLLPSAPVEEIIDASAGAA